MAKAGRPAKKKIPYIKKYEIIIYKKHESGIGHTYIKMMDIEEKPTFENCDFFDETNRRFARVIK